LEQPDVSTLDFTYYSSSRVIGNAQGHGHEALSHSNKIKIKISLNLYWRIENKFNVPCKGDDEIPSIKFIAAFSVL